MLKSTHLRQHIRFMSEENEIRCSDGSMIFRTKSKFQATRFTRTLSSHIQQSIPRFRSLALTPVFKIQHNAPFFRANTHQTKGYVHTYLDLNSPPPQGDGEMYNAVRGLFCQLFFHHCSTATNYNLRGVPDAKQDSTSSQP